MAHPYIDSFQRGFFQSLLDVQRLCREGDLGTMTGDDSGYPQENILFYFVIMHPLGGIGEGVDLSLIHI